MNSVATSLVWSNFRRQVPVLEHVQLQDVAAVRTERVWLISPWFDALFICGLAPWIFGFLAYLLTQGFFGYEFSLPIRQGADFAFIVASLLIGESHQFGSINRLFSIKNFKRNRQAWLLIGMFWAAVIAGMVGFPFGGVVLVYMSLFPMVLLHHICVQAKTVGLMYCGKAQFRLSRFESGCLNLVVFLLVLYGGQSLAGPLFANMHIPIIPIQITVLCWEAAALGTGLVVWWIARRGFRTGEWLPLGAGLLWANLAAFILLPLPITLHALLFVPLLFHATQHWAVHWITYKRENDLKLGKVELFKMALPVLATTVVILFLPLMISMGTQQVNASLPVELSMVVFYYHFFADRVVWRNS